FPNAIPAGGPELHDQPSAPDNGRAAKIQSGIRDELKRDPRWNLPSLEINDDGFPLQRAPAIKRARVAERIIRDSLLEAMPDWSGMVSKSGIGLQIRFVAWLEGRDRRAAIERLGPAMDRRAAGTARGGEPRRIDEPGRLQDRRHR